MIRATTLLSVVPRARKIAMAGIDFVWLNSRRKGRATVALTAIFHTENCAWGKAFGAAQCSALLLRHVAVGRVRTERSADVQQPLFHAVFIAAEDRCHCALVVSEYSAGGGCEQEQWQKAPHVALWVRCSEAWVITPIWTTAKHIGPRQPKKDLDI